MLKSHGRLRRHYLLPLLRLLTLSRVERLFQLLQHVVLAACRRLRVVGVALELDLVILLQIIGTVLKLVFAAVHRSGVGIARRLRHVRRGE